MKALLRTTTLCVNDAYVCVEAGRPRVVLGQGWRIGKRLFLKCFLLLLTKYAFIRVSKGVKIKLAIAASETCKSL